MLENDRQSSGARFYLRRWLSFLFLANFFLALAVIYSTHTSRMLQMKMEGLRMQEDRLLMSHRQLLIERGAWLNLSALQKKAVNEWQMYLPKPAEIFYINR